ncbi:MAG: hypothetical protein AAF404_21160, partial [Pseudomonadota bacterium]
GRFQWQGVASYDAPLTYYPQADTLFLQRGTDNFVSLLQGSNTVSVELLSNNQPLGSFTFELAGSSKAIEDAFARCNIPKT